MLKAFLIAGLLAATPFSQTYAADVIDGWARASMTQNAKNGAAYMMITNPTDKDDTLVSVSSEVAEHTEVHSMTFEEGVMRMNEVEALEIPAGETVKLEPGGYHIMLMGLKEPLRVGNKFDIIMTFENSGEQVVPVEVHPRRN